MDGIKEQLNNGRILEQVDSLNLSKEDLIKWRKEILYLIKNTDYEKKISAIDILLEDKNPELWINPDKKDFYSFDNSSELKDIKVKNYKHMGKIKFPIAQ